MSAQSFAEEHQSLYFEVNALGGQGVVEAVDETLRLSLEPLFFQFKGGVNRFTLNKLRLVATSSVKQ